MLNEYLADDNKYISPAASGFKVKDFKMLMGAVNGTLDNFIIFNNAGGKLFDIWPLTMDKKAMVESLEEYAFAYKIDGKEVVLKKMS